jgi:hypothetical protein
LWLESFISFFSARRQGLRLLWLSSLCSHPSTTLTVLLDLHTSVVEMKVDHPVLYTIEIQIEHLAINL